MNPNLISNIDAIDELTELIHGDDTPVDFIPYFEGLRDRRMSDYESSSSVWGQYIHRVFDINDHGQTPIVTYGVNKFDLPNGYTLEIAEWTHPVLKLLKNQNNDFIYIRDPNGKMIFTESDQYYVEKLFDEKQNIINSSEGHLVLNNEVLVSDTLYSLCNMVRHNGSSCKTLFHHIVNNWDEKGYGYQSESKGKQCILGHWRNQINSKDL
jgi:hypothetical protein